MNTPANFADTLFSMARCLNCFCPNCGSSQVVKELSYDEFLDDEEAFIAMLRYDEYKNKGA
jgi:hypothetical protein